MERMHAILSRRLILLAIMLYEQLLIRPNLQFLSTQQPAYQSFLVTSWFDSVCVNVSCRVNFRENIYMNMNYSY